MIREALLQLLFPAKCVLCTRLLHGGQTGICHCCRSKTGDFPDPRIRLPHLESWTALWYYEGEVRDSLLRYKFQRRPAYAQCYGQLLAVKLLQRGTEFDLLTWVPASRRRRRNRGYDQVALLAAATAKELGLSATALLKKIRDNPPQSGLGSAAARRANVLGAYRVIDPQLIVGKRILLLDDVITTGATAGECARMLLTAGAKEVHLLCVAAANHQVKTSR